MSRAREVAHLGVINNSWRDHRDYTEKARVAEERNHRTTVERGEGEGEKNNKIQLRNMQADINTYWQAISSIIPLLSEYLSPEKGNPINS